MTGQLVRVGASKSKRISEHSNVRGQAANYRLLIQRHFEGLAACGVCVCSSEPHILDLLFDRMK